MSRVQRPPSAPSRGRHGASPLVQSRQLSEGSMKDTSSPYAVTSPARSSPARRPQSSLAGRPQSAKAGLPSAPPPLRFSQLDRENDRYDGDTNRLPFDDIPRRVYRPPSSRAGRSPGQGVSPQRIMSPHRPHTARMPRPLSSRNPRTYTGWGYRDTESPYVQRVDMPSFCYPYEYMLAEPQDVGDKPGLRPPTPGRRPPSARRHQGIGEDKNLPRKVSKRSVNRVFKRLGEPTWKASPRRYYGAGDTNEGTSPRAPRRRKGKGKGKGKGKKKKKNTLEETERDFPIGDGRQGTLDKLLFLAGNLRPGEGNDHLIKRVRTIIDKLHNAALARRAEHHRQSLLRTISIPEPDPAMNRHNYLGQESADDLEASFSDSTPLYHGRVRIRPGSGHGRDRYGDRDMRDQSTATEDEDLNRSGGRRSMSGSRPDDDPFELSEDSDTEVLDPIPPRPATRVDIRHRVDQDQAAAKIQAVYRGRVARQRVSALRTNAPSRQSPVRASRQNEAQAATNIQRMHRGRMARREMAKKRDAREQAKVAAEAQEKKQQAQAATKIQARYRGHRVRKQSRNNSSITKPTAAAPTREEHVAATRIQARYRGHRTRKEQNRPASVRKPPTGPSREEHAAATKIQARYRGHKDRLNFENKRNQRRQQAKPKTAGGNAVSQSRSHEHSDKEDEAARRIQKAVRGKHQGGARRQDMDDHLLAYLSDSASLYNEPHLIGSERLAIESNSVIAAAVESESEREGGYVDMRPAHYAKRGGRANHEDDTSTDMESTTTRHRPNQRYKGNDDDDDDVPADLLAEYALEEQAIRREYNQPHSASAQYGRRAVHSGTAPPRRVASPTVHSNLHDSLLDEAYGTEGGSRHPYLEALAESETDDGEGRRTRYGLSEAEDSELLGEEDSAYRRGHRGPGGHGPLETDTDDESRHVRFQ